MSPPTKKRKKSPPNRTLIDFFSNTDARKRPRADRSRTSQQLAAKVGPRRIATRDIIVIDSDSDDGVYGMEAEKRKMAVSEDSAVLQDIDAFGVPSELLDSTSPQCVVLHQPQISPAFDHKLYDSETMFGGSAPLLECACVSSENESQSKFRANDYISTVAEGNLINDLLAGFPLGEWAVGDDELAALELPDDGDVCEEDVFDEQRFCPICGMVLTRIHLEAQTHVNQCLDKTLQNGSSPTPGCTSIAVSVKFNMSSASDGVSRGTFVEDNRSDLYTVLMNPHKENEIWPEADSFAHLDPKSIRGNCRRAPFYKILQDMPIAVDAFCYGTIPGVTAYFLTHAHSDHYTSLGPKWDSGPIYCSEETANLVMHMLAVDPKWFHPLPFDVPVVIPDTGGVKVTLIEANHCPGSSLFFFEGVQTIDAGESKFKSPFSGSRVFRYLHCGDFRASPRHVLHPAVNGKHIDHIYLDTTYLDPKYTFSPQPLVISACADLARRLVIDNSRVSSFSLDAWMKPLTSEKLAEEVSTTDRILVIVGTYSIGKERIVKAIAQALGSKVYCDSRKTAILRCQADKELHALLTANPTEAGVHILPLGTVTSDNLKSYLQRFKDTFSRVIAFRPTGWTYSPPSGTDLANATIQSIISRGQSRHFSYADLKPSPKSSHDIQMFGVPYSEHSSFFELTCFAMSCDWGRIIPTVNVGSPTSRAKMTKWLKRWESEKRCSKTPVIQPRAADYW